MMRRTRSSRKRKRGKLLLPTGPTSTLLFVRDRKGTRAERMVALAEYGPTHLDTLMEYLRRDYGKHWHFWFNLNATHIKEEMRMYMVEQLAWYMGDFKTIQALDVVGINGHTQLQVAPSWTDRENPPSAKMRKKLIAWSCDRGASQGYSARRKSFDWLQQNELWYCGSQETLRYLLKVGGNPFADLEKVQSLPLAFWEDAMLHWTPGHHSITPPGFRSQVRALLWMWKIKAPGLDKNVLLKHVIPKLCVLWYRFMSLAPEYYTKTVKSLKSELKECNIAFGRNWRKRKLFDTLAWHQSASGDVLTPVWCAPNLILKKL